MQIHELDDYTKALNNGAYFAVDDGTDTGKIVVQDILADAEAEITNLNETLNARIDNIIAGGEAPSVSEIVDARQGANGVTYSSLGTAIRDQIEGIETNIGGSTDNLYFIQPGTYNGVTVTQLDDGGIRIIGTCTQSINITQNIEPISGPWTLEVDSDISITSGDLRVTVRNASGSSIYQMDPSGVNTRYGATASASNPIAKVDLTLLSGKTYNYTLYIQLLNSLLYNSFRSHYSAVDRVSRDFIDKGFDFVTPQMYGAVADGTTDDYNAIMAAINSGKNVFFPPGTYYISRTIVVPEVFYTHKMFADADRERHNAYIKCGALPAISIIGQGWEINGLGFTQDAFPDLTGVNPENKAYIQLYAPATADDLDITIENCYFEKNYCMILAVGRNVNIRNNLFYDMGNTGYCIYFNYPDTADGESDTNVNGFKNNYSGFRGLIVEKNRCHYTRNWLVNTRASNCQNIKGMVIRDNYLEGAFCLTGFLNNALVANNITFQVNHSDWTADRRDACFDLIEMNNTIIDGYYCAGSDAYTNQDGVTIPEAIFARFLYVAGKCTNNRISDVFVTNFLYHAFWMAQGATSLRMDATIRKTRTTSNPIALGTGSYHNIIDVTINDVTDTPQEGQYIIDWYPRENADDNYFRVTSNYECVKYPE